MSLRLPTSADKVVRSRSSVTGTLPGIPSIPLNRLTRPRHDINSQVFGKWCHPDDPIVVVHLHRTNASIPRHGGRLDHGGFHGVFSKFPIFLCHMTEDPGDDMRTFGFVSGMMIVFGPSLVIAVLTSPPAMQRIHFAGYAIRHS